MKSQPDQQKSIKRLEFSKKKSYSFDSNANEALLNHPSSTCWEGFYQWKSYLHLAKLNVIERNFAFLKPTALDASKILCEYFQLKYSFHLSFEIPSNEA